MPARATHIHLVAALIAVSSLLPAATRAHEGETHAAPVAAPLAGDALAVAATLERYADALTANDLERVRPLILDADTFTCFEGSHIDRGWQAYHDHLAPEMALFEHPDYRITDIRPYVAGDLAYATYAWTFDVTIRSAQFEGGEHRVSMTGTGTAVLGRFAGAWRLRHVHTAQAPARRTGAAPH